MKNFYYINDLGANFESSPNFPSKGELLAWAKARAEKYAANFEAGVVILQNDCLTFSQIIRAKNGALVVRKIETPPRRCYDTNGKVISAAESAAAAMLAGSNFYGHK